ncbi:MAG: hypothetical protein KGI38_00515 [Thaumarchaeota archaeon]|nr:hypothetical protein [Nitrososphaerota archaeon]
MKVKIQVPYQAGFVYGFFGTYMMVNPYLPVTVRIALLPLLLGGATFTLMQGWFRYIGRKAFADGSRWGQLIEGIAAGTATTILILTIVHFYFGVPVVIPSL